MARDITHDAQLAPGGVGAARPPRPARGVFATLYRGVAWLTLAGLAAQVYLAGAGAFGARTYALHATWGLTLSLPILLLLILAFLGRVGRLRTAFTALLLVLYLAQLLLAELRTDAPYVAALHAENALALLGVTFVLARGQGAPADR